jgi:hypothetical protein
VKDFLHFAHCFFLAVTVTRSDVSNKKAGILFKSAKGARQQLKKSLKENEILPFLFKANAKLDELSMYVLLLTKYC